MLQFAQTMKQCGWSSNDGKLNCTRNLGLDFKAKLFMLTVFILVKKKNWITGSKAVCWIGPIASTEWLLNCFYNLHHVFFFNTANPQLVQNCLWMKVFRLKCLPSTLSISNAEQLECPRTSHQFIKAEWDQKVKFHPFLFSTTLMEFGRRGKELRLWPTHWKRLAAVFSNINKRAGKTNTLCLCTACVVSSMCPEGLAL